MNLSPEDCQLFYRLHMALVSYAGQKLEVLPNAATNPPDFLSLPLETRLKVRDAVHGQPELIDEFVKDNPASFSADELEIVSSWRHALIGSFYIFRYLKRYAVFLEPKSPPKAYGVLALMDPFDEVVGPHLPIYTETILLPFKDQIIYDGALQPYRITFGPGIRRGLNDDYREAKATFGIITSLPHTHIKRRH